MLKKLIPRPLRRFVVGRKAEKRKQFRRKVIETAESFRRIPIIEVAGYKIEKVFGEPVETVFVKSHSPKMNGKTAIYFGPADHESMFALTLRFQDFPTFKGQAKISINGPDGSVIRLNQADIAQLKLYGLNKNSPICIVEAIQGINGSKRRSQKLNHSIGTHWPVFLMQEVIRYSKERGMKAVLILKPEFNNLLLDYIGHPTTDSEKKKRQSMLNLYYSSAKKLGFSKPKGSRYFWMVLK